MAYERKKTAAAVGFLEAKSRYTVHTSQYRRRKSEV